MGVHVISLERYSALKNSDYFSSVGRPIGACDVLSDCAAVGDLSFYACKQCPLYSYPIDTSNMSIKEEYAFAIEEVLLHKALGNINVGDIEGLDNGN